MSETLTLHVGLPKTASTLLQSRVFHFLPGYLGNQYPNPRLQVRPPLLSLYEASLGKGRHRSFVRRSRDLTHALGLLKELDPPHLLYSSEEFAQWPSRPGGRDMFPVVGPRGYTRRRGPHPIVKFVEEIVQQSPASLQIRTVLVLRNQTDFLGSLAAQVDRSDTNFIQRVIQDDDAYLHYDNWIRDLTNVVGEGNHLTLIYEDGVEDFGGKLVRFADPDAPFNLQFSHEHEVINRKRIDSSSWEGVPRTTLHGTALYSFIDWATFTKAFRGVRPFFRRVYQVVSRLLPERVETIHISPIQRSSIQSHFRSSNARLSANLQRNLGELGY